MNERIEQLADQCWVHTNEPLFGAKSPHWEFDRHKFAQLIVRECADVAKETRWAVPPSQEQIARGIQQHFGVEE